MKMTPRESMLAVATGIAVLYGVSSVLMRSKLEAWRALRKDQSDLLAQIEQDRQLSEERGKWDKQLASLNLMVPPFPADRKVDVHWLSVMDQLAARHGVSITKRQAGEEKQAGDLYEMSIDCKEFEGTLDATVRFLFDLQAENAMLDVRQLFLKPKGGGVLRGRFILYCAYTREGGSRTK